MTRLFTNNASTTLNGAISASATTIVVANGAVFPALISPDHFVATITQPSGTESSWEDVKITARSGNTLTCLPTVGGWADGSKIEIRWNAEEAQAAANVALAGSTVLDFGTGGHMAVATVIGQTDIKATSIADAWVPFVATVDHTDLEHLVSGLHVACGNIVPGVSFDIVGYSEQHLTGQFNVNWIRTV